MKERIDDGHLLCSGPYDSYRSVLSILAGTMINMVRIDELELG